MTDKFILRNEAIRGNALARLLGLDLSKPWEVTIRPYRKSRSLEQNNLLWSWYGIIAADTGHTADDIHEYCKQKFLPPVFVDVNGETIEVRRTTTKLKVDEMTAYMDQVFAWATGELGLALPLPEDRYAA